MADVVFESATERFKKELDPKYQVVFDTDQQLYFVTRWRQTGCSQGYYAVQGRGYQVWEEERVLEQFKHGHWRSDNLSDQDYEQEIFQDHEQVEKEQIAKVDEAGEEMAKDILDYYAAPVIRSIPGINCTRLQG